MHRVMTQPIARRSQCHCLQARTHPFALVPPRSSCLPASSHGAQAVTMNESAYSSSPRVRRNPTFSPRKFLISAAEPFSWMIKLIGKCAYTNRTLYRKPFVTPVIMFSMSDLTVLRQATCLRPPCHTTSFTFVSRDSAFGLTTRRSMSMC